MDNFFRHRGMSLSPSEIAVVAKTLGVKIPQDVVRFYLTINSGFPTKTYCIADGKEQVRIQRFFPMNHPTKFSDTIESVYQTGLNEDYLVKGLVPFAQDFGGNFVCFDETGGGVVFYTMDTWGSDVCNDQNKREAMVPLTDSFQRFLGGLQPQLEYSRREGRHWWIET